MAKSVSMKRLKSIIGDQAFQALVNSCAGRIIYIPKHCHDRISRDISIRQEFYEGSNVDDLVKKYELSKSSIYRILES